MLSSSRQQQGEQVSEWSSEIRPDQYNPFPGLRPFSPDESNLYFGREGQIDEILQKLSVNRFVCVMGYSGSGKSSLMSCGLIPVLQGGFIVHSSANWHIILTRPGTDPTSNVCDSILDYLIENKRVAAEDRHTVKTFYQSVLRTYGTYGLVEVCRIIQEEFKDNVFILIDQFEEIFRFHDNQSSDQTFNELQHFVNQVVTAVQQQEIPIYFGVTLRSDFIARCAAFPGLTELINNSNYLVPQMTRVERKMAIRGPVEVAGGRISYRLVSRLLNDMGHDQDQLPILQHAMMRTWDYWVNNREEGEPIDLRHYLAVGGISQALSQHANEIFEELTSRQKEIAEILFKSITEKRADNRGMRRPCKLSLIGELAEADVYEVIEVIEHFRKPGRSFLMPVHTVPLSADTLVELSHESLMRIWNRLDLWVNEEFESAAMYKRLSEAAEMYQIGKTSLWRPPDLQLALNWQQKQRPTREWAQRYNEAFERVVVFLDTSRIYYESELKNQELLQSRTLRRTRSTAIILGIAAIIAILFFILAYLQKVEADIATLAAEHQVARDQAYRSYQNALAQEQLAKKAGELEKESRILADGKTVEAQKNLEIANRLYMLTIAQAMAGKSVQEDDDKDLAGALAMQSYHFHRRYDGKRYDPYIYNALYHALTVNAGSSYNAVRVPGVARNRMTSVAVSRNKNIYYRLIHQVD